MAIVKMSKFNLAIFEKDRARVCEKLQEFEFVHLDDVKKDLSDEDRENLNSLDVTDDLKAVNDRLARAEWLIDKLSRYRKKKPLFQNLKEGVRSLSFEDLKEEAKNFNFELSYQDFKSKLSELDRLEAEIDENQKNVDDWQAWKGLDLKLSDLRLMNKSRLITGFISPKLKEKLKRELEELELTDLEFVSEDKKKAYFYLITVDQDDEKLSEILQAVNFTEVKLSSSSSALDMVNGGFQQIEKVRNRRDDLRAEIKEKARVDLEKIELEYELLANKKKLLEANDKFMKTKFMTFLDGYIPSRMSKKFEETIRSVLGDDYVLDMRAADKDDPNVPIILKNKGLIEPFESVVKTYSMPKYYEIDPTPTVAPFYAVFFGFMVGDVGYGLVLLTLTSLALSLFNMKKKTRQFIRFFQLLSIPTIIAGLVYGSFFGDLIKIPGLIDTNTQYIEMMIASVAIGVIHIFFGLGIKGYMEVKDGKIFDALVDVLSWYMILIGGIGFLLGGILGLDKTLTTVFMWLMIAGCALVLLFSARNEKSKFARLAWGTYNLYGVSSYVGDLVSYTRIAALALSGAYIGSAVNMIAKMVFDMGVLGIVPGVAVIVIFHAFNLFLSSLSGYVHSMRLIYVEFYGKFYEGGGVNFDKLRADGKYIEIKDKEI